MAAYPQDAVDLGVPGVDVSSLVVTATHPTAGVLVVYTMAGWLAGWNGTITPDGLGGYDVSINVHPPLTVGVWTIDVVANSNSGLPGGGSWAFTVAADSPTVTLQSPLGVTTDLIRIGCRCLDDWGFDLTTLSLTAKPSDSRPGDVLTAISAGAIQAGWAGVITPSVGSPTVLDIVLTSWPAALDAAFPSKLWTFTVSCDTIVGTSL